MNKASAIKKLNDTELELGIAGTAASWHQRYSECDCVYVGGLPDTLTEQDLLGVLEQYGTVIHLNLIRDSHSNASKGFAFVRYADPRSCILAIDNLNGFELQGRTLRLDHADDYQDKEEVGLDTAPEGFYRRREETTNPEQAPEEDLHTSPAELPVEKRRQSAVLERLEQLRKKRRIDVDENRNNEMSEEIQPSREKADLSTRQDQASGEQSDHAAAKKRRRAEREKRRREKEQRKAERARIRQERAEKRASRENGT